jgi:hypothetical protein
VKVVTTFGNETLENTVVSEIKDAESWSHRLQILNQPKRVILQIIGCQIIDKGNLNLFTFLFQEIQI